MKPCGGFGNKVGKSPEEFSVRIGTGFMRLSLTSSGETFDLCNEISVSSKIAGLNDDVTDSVWNKDYTPGIYLNHWSQYVISPLFFLKCFYI
jgi:hypothetical protein